MIDVMRADHPMTLFGGLGKDLPTMRSAASCGQTLGEAA
jgi:hypothetical protein